MTVKGLIVGTMNIEDPDLHLSGRRNTDKEKEAEEVAAKVIIRNGEADPTTETRGKEERKHIRERKSEGDKKGGIIGLPKIALTNRKKASKINQETPAEKMIRVMWYHQVTQEIDL